jgi:hypothetical protein
MLRCAKAALAVAEIEAPLADGSARRSPSRAHLLQVRFEGLAPGVEGAGVTEAELLEAVQLEAALLGHEFADAVDRGSSEPGKMCFWMKSTPSRNCA